MKIRGFIENTFLDWEGKISSIIFTQGCNFRCCFCHNSELIPLENNDLIDEEIIISYLLTNKKWIDGVIISGGEPTIQKDLMDFLIKIKNLGFLIKLDTNGYNPDVLKQIIKFNLVDYISIDIKSNFLLYSKICGIDVDTSKILESIDLLMESNFDFEFRTTLVPNFARLESLEKIALLVKNRRWCWQKFKYSSSVFDKTLQKEFSDEEIDFLEKKIKYKFSYIDIIRR